MADPRAIYSPGTGRGAAAILPDNGQQVQSRIASEIERRRAKRRQDDLKKEKEQNAFLRKVKAGLPKSPDGAYLGDLDNLYTMRKAIEEFAVDSYMNGDDPFSFGTEANKRFRRLQQGYEKAIQYSKERAKNVNKYATYYEQNRDKLDEETMANLNEYKDLPLEEVPKWNKPFVVDKAPEFSYEDVYNNIPSFTAPGNNGAKYFDKKGAEKFAEGWLNSPDAELFKQQFGDDAKNVFMDMAELKAKENTKLPTPTKTDTKFTPDVIGERKNMIASVQNVVTENGINDNGVSAMLGMVGGDAPNGGKIKKVEVYSPRVNNTDINLDWIQSQLGPGETIDKNKDYLIITNSDNKPYLIDLTNPGSFSVINNIYNKVPGNISIPIDKIAGGGGTKLPDAWWEKIQQQ